MDFSEFESSLEFSLKIAKDKFSSLFNKAGWYKNNNK